LGRLIEALPIPGNRRTTHREAHDLLQPIYTEGFLKEAKALLEERDCWAISGGSYCARPQSAATQRDVISLRMPAFECCACGTERRELAVKRSLRMSARPRLDVPTANDVFHAANTLITYRSHLGEGAQVGLSHVVAGVAPALR
jgi:hypothetical protein